MLVGTYIGNGTHGSGIMTVSGGTFTQDTNIVRLGRTAPPAGTLNVGGGTATAYVNLPAITFGSNGASTSGTLNLYANGILNVEHPHRATGSGTFNFNGGTLQASGNNSYLPQRPDRGQRVGRRGDCRFANQHLTIAQSLLNGTGGGADGGLTKVGAGTLILAGGNTYTGGTSIEAGTLRMANADALGTGNLTVNAGTLDLAGYSPSVAGLGGLPAPSSPVAPRRSRLPPTSPAARPPSAALSPTAPAPWPWCVGGTGTQVLSGINTYTGGTTHQFRHLAIWRRPDAQRFGGRQYSG